MATTSPDTLRTPDPGDSYNLVADLAILGQDVQNALTLRANAYTGTASQRTAFTSTATDGMLWQDTDGIKMIWRKDGAAWVPAVWHWSGTTAQMSGFAAPNGFSWTNTALNNQFIRISGSWSPMSLNGSVSTSLISSGGFEAVPVTFSHAFNSAPKITASAWSGRLTVGINSVTVSGCTLAVNNWSSGSAPATSITWKAEL